MNSTGIVTSSTTSELCCARITCSKVNSNSAQDGMRKKISNIANLYFSSDETFSCGPYAHGVVICYPETSIVADIFYIDKDQDQGKDKDG